MPGIHVRRRNTKSLGVNRIRTEHKIKTTADIERLAFGYHGALYKQIKLIKLKSVGPIGESNGAIISIAWITRVVSRSSINPASDLEATIPK